MRIKYRSIWYSKLSLCMECLIFGKGGCIWVPTIPRWRRLSGSHSDWFPVRLWRCHSLYRWVRRDGQDWLILCSFQLHCYHWPWCHTACSPFEWNWVVRPCASVVPPLPLFHEFTFSELILGSGVILLSFSATSISVKTGKSSCRTRCIAMYWYDK